MKNEKGIGLVGVIVLTVVIAILIAGGIYFLRITYNGQRKETIKTSMLKIEWKVKEIQSMAKAKGTTVEYKGIKVSEMKEDSIISVFLSKNIISEEDYEKFYVLSDDDIVALEISNVGNEKNAYYIINYETDEVIYTAGISFDNKNTLYKLSDIKNENINNTQKNNEIETNTNNEN